MAGFERAILLGGHAGRITWECCNKSVGRAAAERLSLRAMSESAPAAPAPLPQIPTHADLFLAFFKISLSGFGSTLPWTQRMFVEKKRWMTAKEFNDAYAVCQFLPGPNIVNLTSVFGSRMHGATGALAAWAGFLGMPFVLMVTIGALYAQFGDAVVLRRILGGIAAAAAGVMISTVTRMAEPLFRAPDRKSVV